MNTANLQLEGLYLAFAAVNNLLVAKGLVSRDEIDLALSRAEQTALGDHRAEELSPANRDAVAFAARLLMLANNSASETETAPFSELARMVGATKEPRDDQQEVTMTSKPMKQRAVADEDPDFSPMDDQPARDEASIEDRAMEVSRKVALQRPFKKDPEDNVSGGFNQKSKP